MKKYQVVFGCLVLLTLSAPFRLLSQEFLWASGMKGLARPYHIATDAEGNSYITGSFYGSATFTDSLTLYGRGSHDIFLAKYAADGSFLWARSAGGGGWDSGEGIGVDEDGNIYVTGYFEENGIFGEDTIQSKSFYYWDVFLAKYNSEGSLMWVTQAGGYDDDCGAALTVKNGNIYIAGTLNKLVIFGNDTLYSGYDVWGNDVFVACYSPAGDCMWARLGAGDKPDYVNDIHADPNGNIYITGSFASGDLTFGSTTILRASGTMYVAKYYPNGELAWARASGGSTDISAHGVAADADGSYYVAGDFRGPAAFDSTALSNYGEYDFFLVKFDPGGNCCWAKHAGSIYYDYGHDVEIGKDGKIYASGRCYKNSYFDDIFFNSLGGVDMALACYDTLGHCEWVLRGGGRGGDDYGRSLSIAENGMIYITGETGIHATYPVTFGSTSLYNISGALACASPVSEHAAVLSEAAISHIGADSALVSADITDPGYPAATAHGFIWSPDKDPLFADACLDLGALTAPKTAAAVLRELLPAREYRVRAYAVNSVDTAYSEILTFTTLGTAMINYLSVSDIDTGSAVLQAVMNILGNPAPSDHGFCWNAAGAPTTADAHIALGSRDSTGAFQAEIGGLSPNTRYYVRAYAVNTLGTAYSDEMEFTTLETSAGSVIPATYCLEQNYPNPFNPATAISYQLSANSKVVLTVHDISGRKVAHLVNSYQNAGYYTLSWDASGFSTGIYFYRLTALDPSAGSEQVFVDTKKMVLMK